MDIAMIGLGKMGADMTGRLLKGGHRVVSFDKNAAAIRAMEVRGAEGARTIEEVIRKLLHPPRVVWMMVPAGSSTEQVFRDFSDRLSPGDVIVDGGNSNYKDSMQRAALLGEKGLHFLDVGTSGGVWGLTGGYGMMIGGKPEVVGWLRPIFETLAPAPDQGWGHVGPAGAGHFVKMVHNGIEYGLMQAYAEGFDLLNRKEFELDLHQIAEIWRHGGVVRSWLLELITRALKENPTLDGIAPFVSDSGEGRWAVLEAIDRDLSAPIITLSLMQRFRSREKEGFSDKLLAAMRDQFGGHGTKGV
uniref:6-phosphogluconate dehydrogenase n=1 Tax=Candidatus Kentrum sp. TUN TaxID=2126343 RepID=A0A450ZBI2_9GAMM|nr:MAG: 6-phosphogluconate dehydrogenase [Candidatus Kentron sp. TUN]VFK51341.1 MAG: 6-phosphogluconate dehydrogenase [Candidatus Kentron sp. TUN]VFK54465.1 MAG: 6-phosphogluconate dehydrogenase [Candidatus Kentron sp. TUN]